VSIAPTSSEPRQGELAAVIADGVRSLYQPIVELHTGNVIAYEALARGPEGSALESPAALFAAAHREDRIVELDRACQTAAVQGAVRAGLRPPAALFVNVEPQALTAALDPAQYEQARRAATGLKVFVEVTERALTLRPAELLDAVERLRAAGFGIALDDVGADRRSLALLPLLRPDVVKLDISLIHNHPSRMSGEVMNGVCAYAEQTGAAIVAEGIEEKGHLLAAETLGATLAQGWFFGRPAPLAGRLDVSRPAATLGVAPRVVHSSPVALAHSRQGLRIGRKDVLLSVSRALEAKALELGEHAVVVAAFQDAVHFTPATQRRYERLAGRNALVAALGVGIGEEPAPGVRGASLAPGDPLHGEWDLAVLGPHYAGALVARDLGDDGADRDRRFEFLLTFDRDLVVDIAAMLIGRVSAGADIPLSLAA
jgi:EAL domain-containing protein (putative c-di-GMP-specific phosphodiesterase class I)/DICT domain-containing protein